MFTTDFNEYIDNNIGKIMKKIKNTKPDYDGDERRSLDYILDYLLNNYLYCGIDLEDYIKNVKNFPVEKIASFAKENSYDELLVFMLDYTDNKDLIISCLSKSIPSVLLYNIEMYFIKSNLFTLNDIRILSDSIINFNNSNYIFELIKLISFRDSFSTKKAIDKLIELNSYDTLIRVLEEVDGIDKEYIISKMYKDGFNSSLIAILNNYELEEPLKNVLNSMLEQDDVSKLKSFRDNFPDIVKYNSSLSDDDANVRILYPYEEIIDYDTNKSTGYIVNEVAYEKAKDLGVLCTLMCDNNGALSLISYMINDDDIRVDVLLPRYKVFISGEYSDLEYARDSDLSYNRSISKLSKDKNLQKTM